MLFSAHLADTGVANTLRRETPQPDKVPGLYSARVAAAARFTPGVMPSPQLNREVMVACWQDEAALDQFLANHPTGRTFADGWMVRMECFRAVGVWPGLDGSDHTGVDVATAVRDVPVPTEGPSVAITIGTAYLKTAIPFMRVSSALEDQFCETPSGLWGTAFSNLGQRLVGTLTVWDSPGSAVDYMRNGAHGAAMKAHYDPKKDPTGHTFTTGGGFFGFRPISTSGSLGGKNPLSANLLAL